MFRHSLQKYPSPPLGAVAARGMEEKKSNDETPRRKVCRGFVFDWREQTRATALGKCIHAITQGFREYKPRLHIRDLHENRAQRSIVSRVIVVFTPPLACSWEEYRTIIQSIRGIFRDYRRDGKLYLEFDAGLQTPSAWDDVPGMIVHMAKFFDTHQFDK